MKKLKRRSFFEKVGLWSILGLGATTLPFQAFASQNNNNFVHHVFFWLKERDSKEAHDKLLKGLKKLSKIDIIQKAHIGKPADTNRDVIDSSYQFSLLLFFKNAKDQDIYQEHPDHLAFIDDNADLLEKVQVYDSVDI